MTFYFYDLETSGFNPRLARIMQFAGQRTDMNLKPVGEPDNTLVKMTSDILPEPDAVMVHGITPQQTITEGVTEAEFTKYLTRQVFTPDTIAAGYNNIRFDDEFIRFTLWRNFVDAYEWQWKGSRGKWDLLDVVRMTRALRPEGIKWPFAPDGKASNRLEDISQINKLEHANAHNALSDVKAVIALANLVKTKQPKLFNYLLKLRDKNKIAALVATGRPFIYTSGRYPAEYEKTTIAVMVAPDPSKNAALVYDLRIDPTPFLSMSPTELAAAWQYRSSSSTQASGVQGAGEQRTELYSNGTAKEQSQPATSQSAASASRVTGSASKQVGAVRVAEPYFPVKVLSYNRCPTIAPLSVLDAKSASRLKINSAEVDTNLAKLLKAEDFGDKLVAAAEIIWPKVQAGIIADPQKVDEQLYDGFINDTDRTRMRVVRAADAEKLADLQLDFADERLKLLLPLYKARNYPKSLSPGEQEQWEKFRRQRLMEGGGASRAAHFFKRLGELEKQTGLAEQDRYLLEELNLYGQSLVPAE
jgi:exodeoxyribonuclease-1